jgi:hypothetical protein
VGRGRCTVGRRKLNPAIMLEKQLPFSSNSKYSIFIVGVLIYN